MRLARSCVQSMFIMSTMHGVHLSGIDMNLLVALDAMLVERSVTRAAKKIGLTQPAMSHALSRLRQLFDDPLFVRSSAGMQPTPRALAVAAPLSRALAEIHSVVARPPAFDPATAKRSFTLATSDYMQLVLLPKLIERLSKIAPGVDLQVRDVPVSLDGLADGTLDLVVRPALTEPRTGLFSEAVFRERFVCVMRRGHPLSRKKLTLDRYCAAKHVLVAPFGATSGSVDEELARKGLARRVALVVPHFLVAPHVVASSDLVVTLGEQMARAMQKMLPLHVVDPPLAVPMKTMTQLWHERQGHDPAHAWLRREVRQTARSLTRPE